MDNGRCSNRDEGEEKGIGEEFLNPNYAALGEDFFPNEELQEEIESLDGTVQTIEEAPVYRSVSTILLNEPAPVNIFRSMSTDTHNEFEFFSKELSSKAAKSTKCYRVSSLRSPIDDYHPAVFHGFTNEDRSQVVLQRLEKALRAEKIDFEEFDEGTSSFSCKVVVDSSYFCFSVYVFSLLKNCSETLDGAKFIIEAQRTRSSGTTAQWSNVIKGLMTHLHDLFMQNVRNSEKWPSFMSNGESLPNDDCLPLLECNLDELGGDFQVSETELEADTKFMMEMACAGESLDMRLQTAEILARLSSERESALRLIRIGAIERVMQSLQAEILVNSANDLVRLYCTLLSNISKFAKEINFMVPFDLGAFVTMTILKTVGSCTKLQMSTLREASRALAEFSSDIHTPQVRDQVRVVALTCANSQDDFLVDHAKQVLRNLGACA